MSKHAEEFGGDASTLAVAGDSAGGNLAAAVTLKARGKQSEGGPNILFQLLVCPVRLRQHAYVAVLCQRDHVTGTVFIE